MKEVEFTLLSAGYCEALESHSLRGYPRKPIRFYATFGLLKHPDKGYILFDTGYTRRFHDETRKWPFSIYARMTKVYIKPEEEAHEQLAHMGIMPSEISYIIISHFHADHIGGLRDFPNATFICSKKGWEDVHERKGLAALKRGFLSGLVPSDFMNRVQFLNFDETSSGLELLGSVSDIFDDGSLLACELDGHAYGQIGITFKTRKQEIFCVSDGSWSWRNYKELHLPSPLVKLIFHSWNDYLSSLRKIHDFHIANPDYLIIPCHCEKTYRNYINEAQ